MLGGFAALWLKYRYSHAGSEELLWLLAPVAWWAGSLGGLSFVHEQGVGYVEHAARFIIAPSCSGVQFLIIALAVFLFSFVHRAGTWKRGGSMDTVQSGRGVWIYHPCERGADRAGGVDPGGHEAKGDPSGVADAGASSHGHRSDGVFCGAASSVPECGHAYVPSGEPERDFRAESRGEKCCFGNREICCADILVSFYCAGSSISESCHG